MTREQDPLQNHANVICEAASSLLDAMEGAADAGMEVVLKGIHLDSSGAHSDPHVEVHVTCGESKSIAIKCREQKDGQQ